MLNNKRILVSRDTEKLYFFMKVGYEKPKDDQKQLEKEKEPKTTRTQQQRLS